MAHIRVNVASAKAISSSVATRAGQSWLWWTGPAASGPESRTTGVDCGWGSEFSQSALLSALVEAVLSGPTLTLGT